MEISFEKLPDAVNLLHQRLDRIEGLLAQQKSIVDQDELFSIAEAAKHLNVSVATVYGYVHDRAIPFSKIRKRLYFSRKELMAWIQSGRRKTIDEINASAEQSIIIKRRK